MYSNELICNILDFLDKNINQKITIEEISNKFNYNHYHIMKLFKKEIGCSINTYINNIRILNSINNLKSNHNYSFTKIALLNGFYSKEYFSKTFHKIIGVSPRTFQNLFFNHHKITIQELNTITTNWTNLQTLKNFTQKYKKNKLPTTIPVLKRSIFNH